MLENSSPFVIRFAHANDMNFILATWLRSLYYGDTWYSDIDKNVFFTEYPRYIQALVKSSNTIVVALADDPDVIIGYACGTATIIHFVYVKKAWRRKGVARLLLNDTGYYEWVTHLTKIGKKLLPKYGWKFNPFISK